MTPTAHIPVVVSFSPNQVALAALTYSWWHSIHTDQEDGHMTVVCRHPTSDDSTMEVELTPEFWGRGLRLMLEKAPRYLRGVLAADSNEACDLLMQYTVYGKEVWA